VVLDVFNTQTGEGNNTNYLSTLICRNLRVCKISGNKIKLFSLCIYKLHAWMGIKEKNLSDHQKGEERESKERKVIHATNKGEVPKHQLL
jgi:hypothetical protein